jgi:cytochrome P450
LFRSAGVDGRVPVDEVEQDLVREISKPRVGESDLLKGLDALTEDFGVSHEEACRAKLAVLWGANVNSQNVTTWTLLHLCSNRDLLHGIMEAVARRFEAATDDWRLSLRSGEIAVTKSDLDALPELASLLWEVARRYGKANVMRSIADDGLVVVAEPRARGHGEKAFAVRKGDWISTFPQIFHRDGRFFQSPLEFRPLRFLARPAGVSSHSATLNTRGERRKSTAVGLKSSSKVDIKARVAGHFVDRRGESTNFLMPFGLGGGACPASSMAMDLVKILVLHVLAAIDLEILGNIPEAEEGGVHAVPPPARSVAFKYEPHRGGEVSTGSFGESSELSTAPPSESDASDDDTKSVACRP